MNTCTQLKCPLTGLYFDDPVVSEEGIIYERMAIEYSIKNSYIDNKKLIPVPIIKDIIKGIDSPDKFGIKKPYYLFRNEFITDLANKNIANLVAYTDIILTDIFSPIQKQSIGYQLLNSDLDNDLIFHIVNNSIDYDVFDFNGNKLIHYASIYSNQQVIRFLIDFKQVSISDKDNKGNLPVHNISKYFTNIDQIMDVFSDKYILSKNDKGLTTAHILAKYINTISTTNEGSKNISPKYELVKNVLMSSAGNIIASNGFTAVHYLCLKNKTFKAIEALMDYIDITIMTAGNEDIHDLLYKNRNLTREQKQALIYDYLVRVNNDTSVVIVSASDDIEYE